MSTEAAAKAAEIKAKLASYRGTDGIYGFSRNPDGSYDSTTTIFPSVAWWSGHLKLPNADPTFDAWSGHHISTDWGVRSVSSDSSIFDQISYHRGSVWPLYTGWVALADYRTGRSLQGYANLLATAQLTWRRIWGPSPKSCQESFFKPLDRSSTHQLWFSAMLLTPTVRGLFGLEADAIRHNLLIAPQLPADWEELRSTMWPWAILFFMSR